MILPKAKHTKTALIVAGIFALLSLFNVYAVVMITTVVPLESFKFFLYHTFPSFNQKQEYIVWWIFLLLIIIVYFIAKKTFIEVVMLCLTIPFGMYAFISSFEWIVSKNPDIGFAHLLPLITLGSLIILLGVSKDLVVRNSQKNKTDKE